MRRKILALLLISFYTINTYSIYFRSIGPEKGLAHPAVISLFQDKLDRIWFGTEEGVSIYDGNNITTYKPYSLLRPALFEGNIVLDITDDYKGDVFFRTEKGVVMHELKTGRFRMISHKSTSALYSKNGKIWSAEGDSLMLWNPYLDKFVFMSFLPEKNVNSILVDDNDYKWIATNDGLFRIPPYGETETIIGGAKCVSLLMDKDNELWVATTSKGLYRVSSDGTVINYNVKDFAKYGLASNDIRQIVEEDDNIWFGTFKGLHCFNKKTNSFTVYTRNDNNGGIKYASIYSLLTDNEGTIWVGTYFGGVYNFSPQKDVYAFYSSSNGMSHPFGGDMVEDNWGNIWVCTEGGGLNCINHVNKKVDVFYKDGRLLPGSNPKSLIYDEEQNCLYIGTNKDGLFRYDLSKNLFTQLIRPKDNNDPLYVINVVKKVDGHRLCLSTDAGVFLYDLVTGEISRVYTPGVPFAYIHIASDGKLWIMDYNKVVVLDYDYSSEYKAYNLKAENVNGRLMRLLETSDGTIYVGTYGSGIMRLNKAKDKFEPFPSTPNENLSSYCYRISEIDNANIAVTGDKGFVVINSKGEISNLLRFNDGLPLYAFNRDCGLLVSDDKNIYIGGTNGVAVLKYQKDTLSSHDGGVYFSMLKVNNRPVYPGDESGILKYILPFTEEIVLEHGVNNIDISIASYSISPNIKEEGYEYNFSAYGDEWFRIVNNNISFPYLSSGKYTLSIRQSGEEKVHTLSMVVLPPWYLAGWAILLWTLIVGTIIYILLRIVWTRRKLNESIRRSEMEKEQMMKINEAKFRFFTNVSHEFRTPLTLIIGQTQMLIDNFNLNIKIHEKLVKIMEQAKNLNELITELIEFRKFEQKNIVLHIKKYNLNEFVETIFVSFKEQAVKQNICLQLHKVSADAWGWFDEKQMKKVFYNLLSNALKYTPKGGCINVSIHISDNTWEVKVADSGIGMTKNDVEHIFDQFYQASNGKEFNNNYDSSGIGLALVKTIVERHVGTIEVKSEVGYGSVFSIKVPRNLEAFKSMENIIIEDDVVIDMNEMRDNSADQSELGDAEKPTIVIVEDNLELNELLAQIFSSLYNVKTARNGLEGIELIRTVMPELVISDIMMPEMDGKTLCKKIKENIELCHIPVILLTALGMKEQMLDGLFCGADDYISKPFDSTILLAKCNNIIKSRRILAAKGASEIAENKLSSIATNELDKKFMDTVEFVVQKNMEDSGFDVDRLAKEVGMSRSVFYNKFKAMTSQTPNDYIMKQRLRKAAILLKENPDMPISEVSDKLGFGSLSYFCRKFKEFYNVSPKQYR